VNCRFVTGFGSRMPVCAAAVHAGLRNAHRHHVNAEVGPVAATRLHLRPPACAQMERVCRCVLASI